MKPGGGYDRVCRMEESHFIDATIFQTKSFDVLSEFALLVYCATCLACSAVLLQKSEKIEKVHFIHINLNDSKFYLDRTTNFLAVLQKFHVKF